MMKKKTILKLTALALCGVLAVSLVPAALADAEGSNEADVQAAGELSPGDLITGTKGDDGSTIQAIDFEYDKMLGDSLIDSFAYELSEVEAYDGNGNQLSTSDITIDKTQKSAIGKARSGDLPLTFSTAGGAKVTVTVTIYPLFLNVYADDFIYNVNNDPLTADLAKTLANVEVWEDGGNTKMDLSKVTVDAGELKAINDGGAGKYDLTFSAPDSEDAVIEVTKSTTGGVIKTRGTINANDFSYTKNIDDAAITEAKIRELSNVSATDKDDAAIDSASITINAAQLKSLQDAKESGTYPITFSIPDGTTKTVNCTLTVNEANEDYIIEASDFSFDLNKGRLTSAACLDYAHAVMKSKSGDTIPDSVYQTIMVNKTQIAAVNDATSDGKFDITFTCKSCALPTTIKVDVTARGNVDRSSLSASNFSFDLKNGRLSAINAKSLAKASATDRNGYTISSGNISVDAAHISTINSAKANGNYPLTFTTGYGKSKTVTVAVTISDGAGNNDGDDDDNKDDKTEKISASNFTFDISSGALTADMAKNFAKVSATDANGEALAMSSILVDDTHLNRINSGTTGTYPLIFSTPSGIQASIQVTVVKNDTKASISASNFSYTRTSSTVLSASAAKTAAKASATDANGTAIAIGDIRVDSDQLAAINAAAKSGSFSLTFSTDDGVSKTVTVTLTYDDGKDDTNKGDAKIIAYDFSYDLANEVLSDSRAKSYAGIRAYDKNGNRIKISQVSVDEDELDDINNGEAGDEYDLTFYTDDAETTIVVTLKDTSETRGAWMQMIIDFLNSIFDNM